MGISGTWKSLPVLRNVSKFWST